MMLTKAYSASTLAPMVGRVGVIWPSEKHWALFRNLHLYERFWKLAVPGRLLVCAAFRIPSLATADHIRQAQRCPHDIQFGLELTSISLRDRDKVRATLLASMPSHELTMSYL